MSGWVDNAGDCDDEAGAIHPGADELCDDVDQDCDGTVDEGLIGPLGDWIEVVPDVGEGTTFDAVVAHEDGFVVAWHLPSDPAVRSSFFDRDGVPLATNVPVQGYGTTERAVIRYSEDGLDPMLFAWIEPDGIFTRLCSTTGACASTNRACSKDRRPMSAGSSWCSSKT
ncbi:MAG TPA: putative metal-binding motif-containing protein, partial [Sandaracinaceae bacterium]